MKPIPTTDAARTRASRRRDEHGSFRLRLVYLAAIERELAGPLSLGGVARVDDLAPEAALAGVFDEMQLGAVEVVQVPGSLTPGLQR